MGKLFFIEGPIIVGLVKIAQLKEKFNTFDINDEICMSQREYFIIRRKSQ